VLLDGLFAGHCGNATGGGVLTLISESSDHR
jgi:hypothetical protein